MIATRLASSRSSRGAPPRSWPHPKAARCRAQLRKRGLKTSWYCRSQVLSKGHQVRFPSACQCPRLPLSPTVARTASLSHPLAEVEMADSSVASELTEAELLELAAVDEPMKLTLKEQEQLSKVRQDCGQLGRENGLSLMMSAQRHAFKLVNQGERRVACLACKGAEPAATGAEGRFLYNFWSRHIKGSSAHADGPYPH